MISGLVTTLVSMPVDIAKTRLEIRKNCGKYVLLSILNRIQTMKTVNGVPEYSGSVVSKIKQRFSSYNRLVACVAAGIFHNICVLWATSLINRDDV